VTNVNVPVEIIFVQLAMTSTTAAVDYVITTSSSCPSSSSVGQVRRLVPGRWIRVAEINRVLAALSVASVEHVRVVFDNERLRFGTVDTAVAADSDDVDVTWTARCVHRVPDQDTAAHHSWQVPGLRDVPSEVDHRVIVFILHINILTILINSAVHRHLHRNRSPSRRSLTLAITAAAAPPQLGRRRLVDDVIVVAVARWQHGYNRPRPSASTSLSVELIWTSK
jgi:hypothetical protein